MIESFLNLNLKFSSQPHKKKKKFTKLLELMKSTNKKLTFIKFSFHNILFFISSCFHITPRWIKYDISVAHKTKKNIFTRQSIFSSSKINIFTPLQRSLKNKNSFQLLVTMHGLRLGTMSKFNCFFSMLFVLLFITHQIAAIDLARLYGHEGHQLQKRSGNCFIFFFS